MVRIRLRYIIFFFNDTATTEIYTLSLHDALPISSAPPAAPPRPATEPAPAQGIDHVQVLHQPPQLRLGGRSEEHTSELQSQSNLVCRLLLEKKKQLHHTRRRYQRSRNY